MAIVYGPYSGRARFGIDISMSPSTVTKDTSSVTLTFKVYLQTNRTVTPGYAGTYTLTRTGSGPTGSSSESVYTQGTTPQLLGTWTQSVSTSYTGTVVRTMGVSFTSALFDGSTPSASVSFTVPKRPPQLPSQATAASAVFVSDARIDVSWTRPANASSTSTIWSNVVVQRRLGVGSWSTVATLSGTATSWSDRTVTGNARYRWRVAGKNASGTGPWRETDDVATTPAAPTVVTAAKNAAGDIVVTWQDNAPFDVEQEVRDNGTLLATVAEVDGPGSYTHVSPNPSVAHTYTVRSVATGPRYSPWSAESNTVQLLAPPAQPTLVGPVGTSAIDDGDAVLAWQHQPVDTTPQTQYETRYRAVGSPTWIESGTVTSSAQTRSVSAAAAGDYEWQVRTRGAHATFSPWSPVFYFTRANRPTATINEPSATVPGSRVTVEWSYYAATGGAQAAWQVELVSGGSAVQAATGDNAGAAWTSSDVLTDGSPVTVRVRVRSAAGLWSEWDEVTEDVTFTPPAESLVDAQWVTGQGHVLLTAYGVSAPPAPATVAHTVERSLDGGVTWTSLGEYGANVDLLDYETPITGTFQYRVTALSALPSRRVTVVEVTVPDIPANRAVWLGGGTRFEQAVQLPWNPTVSYGAGRSRTLHEFAGRTEPVETGAVHRPFSVSVSADILPPSANEDGATLEDLLSVFDLPGPHLLRLPDGLVLHGTLSPLQAARELSTVVGVSFTVTRSARGTDSQRVSIPELVEIQ